MVYAAGEKSVKGNFLKFQLNALDSIGTHTNNPHFLQGLE
jgi:hypothetical protein